MKIAISGKGGVGKTFITSILAKYFLKKGFKVLAIDADPSPNLAINLGLTFNEARKITPISENFDLIKERTDSGVPGVYRLNFRVEDIIENYSITTPSGINLIVMGVVKSADGGCTCPANAVIKALLKHLFTKREEIVVMDMEAGTEHIGRGTAKYVDLMLIVSDASLKSLETAFKIYNLSISMGLRHIFLIGNKVSSNRGKEAILKFAYNKAINVIGFIPYDYKIIDAELYEKSFLDYVFQPETIYAIEEIGEKILRLKN